MTRPIFEPSPARTDRKLGFSSDQLFRRPAPTAGESSIPIFHAEQGFHHNAVADGSTTLLTFDTWDNTDLAVFDEGVVAGELNSVILLQEGLYSFTCSVEWAANWNATMFISLLSDYDFSQVAGFPGSAGGWVGSPACTFTLVMPAPLEPLPGTMAVSWTVRQHSGLSRNTDFGTFIQCHYYGPVSASVGS